MTRKVENLYFAVKGSVKIFLCGYIDLDIGSSQNYSGLYKVKRTFSIFVNWIVYFWNETYFPTAFSFLSIR